MQVISYKTTCVLLCFIKPILGNRYGRDKLHVYLYESLSIARVLFIGEQIYGIGSEQQRRQRHAARS